MSSRLQAEIEPDNIFFFESGSPERSSGWVDGFHYDTDTEEWAFFDAEQNQLFPISPIGDLASAIKDLGLDEESLRQERSNSKEFSKDPYAYYGVNRSDFL
jgi:hypothetical protein